MDLAEIPTPSGLAVVCQERSDREIELELKRLDRDLFLTKEVHRPSGAWFYAVYHWQGSNRPPLHVLYWTHDRTRTGQPLPLSSGIFYEVESRKQFAGRNLARESAEANAAKQAADLAEADAEREEEITPYFRQRLKFGPSTRDRLHADDPFARGREKGRP